MKFIGQLLRVRELILMRDPCLLHWVLHRLETMDSDKMFSPTTISKEVVMSLSMPLSIWHMKYIFVRFKLDANANSNLIEGKTGYAYAMVGKYGTVQWLSMRTMHRDATDLYNLFWDKPALLSSMVMDEMENIKALLA